MIIEFNKNQDLVFNWEDVPEQLKTNIELRDKLFHEVKDKYKLEEIRINPKILFEMNKYVLDRILNQSKTLRDVKK